MGAAFGLVGFLAMLASAVGLIVQSVRKQPRRPWLIVMACGIGSFVLGFSITSATRKDAATSAAVQTKTLTPAELAAQAEAQRLATERAGRQWLARARADCAEFESGRNEIMKSAAHRKNQRFIVETTIPFLRGTLASLSTTHGGGTAMIRVESDGFQFSQSVKRGHPLYDVLSQLTEGSCVEVAASIEEANGMSEHAEVCDYDYDVHFSSLRACPSAAPGTP